MSFENILFFTPQESLKYPEAHIVFESLVSFVSSLEGSLSMTGLVLDCKNVDYIDYTGLQMLLCVKDFLAEHTGYHVPLYFHNPRPQHTNRLTRVNSYDPFSTNTADALSPTLSTRTPSCNPSIQGGSPILESLPSPTEISSIRMARSDSLSQSTRRVAYPIIVNSPPSTISEDAVVPPSIDMSRTRSYSTTITSSSTPPSLRSKTSASTVNSQAVVTSVTTDKTQRTTLGYFLKKLRVAPSRRNYSDSDSEFSSDDDADFDPFKGTSNADSDPNAFQSIYSKELKRFKRREAAIAAGKKI
ncbi:UNVERIFIED_CONTAM: hypothetical protein HDU68_010729 [Siphonaria sp. JEL0065]|nr:hypothetical protein HDU68_010729 [Siphonaria sp. JEL0065]